MLTNRKSLYVALLILIGSFTLRFLHLGAIPGPVFDEVFYPVYGFNYLTGEEFYYVHPPLANYMYAEIFLPKYNSYVVLRTSIYRDILTFILLYKKIQHKKNRHMKIFKI